jgi:UDP-N-acetyl-D-mannosaminuronic acid dehydrogenase
MKNLINPDFNVCILGLGFVGVTLAAIMADVGFQVIGIEVRDEVIEQLSSGHSYFFEPGLSSRLKIHLKNGSLQIHKQIPENCKATVYVITVGTPLNEKKQIDLESIKNICHQIALNLKDGDLIIVRSTVKLGTTRSIIDPIFKATGKQYEIAFCPERTIEGRALEELRTNPQIIGAEQLTTKIRASQIFQWITPTVLTVSDWETAEMIKLIDNTKRDVSFAFANEVARICDVAGLSADEVLRLGRFGYVRGNIPNPGPVGGPCLSKDPHILVQSMSELGMIPKMTVAARQIHEEQPHQVATFLRQFMKENYPEQMIISLLGIAFKGNPVTDDIRGTPAKSIFQTLKQEFPHAEFRGYDPIVPNKAIRDIGLQPKNHLQQVFKGAHLVLILNNHPQFSTLPIDMLAAEMAQPALIYDFWNHYHSEKVDLPKGVQYIGLGNHKFINKS